MGAVSKFLFVFSFILFQSLVPSSSAAATSKSSDDKILSIDDVLIGGDVGIKPMPTIPAQGGDTKPKPGTPPVATNPGSSNPGGSNPSKPGTPPPAGSVGGTGRGAEVASQFQCPMFSSSPLSDVQNSLTNLKNAIGANVQCSKETLTDLSARGQRLLQAVEEIDKMKDEWSSDYETPSPIKNEIYEKRIQNLNARMKAAIEEAEGIASIVRGNILSNPSCGRQYSNPERIIFGVNDLIQGLAPIALKVAGSNPAFAPALPYVFGATLLSSGVSVIRSMADGTKKLDLSDKQNRRALVQNTCQFVKVYRTVNYLQLAKDRRIEDLDAGFAKDARFVGLPSTQSMQSQVQKTISWRNNQLSGLNVVQERLFKNDEQLSAAEDEIERNPNSPEVVCSVGEAMLISGQASQQSGFPVSVMSDLEQLAKSRGDANLKYQLITLKRNQEDAVARVSRVVSDGSRSVNEKRECGISVARWVKDLRRALGTTSNILESLRSNIEVEAAKNPQYKLYAMQMKEVKKQELNKIKMQKILEELDSNPQLASAIERSDLSVEKDAVLDALFGRNWVGFTDQPVKRWMIYQENIMREKKNEFATQFRLLKARQESIAPFPVRDSKRPLSLVEENKLLVKRAGEIEKLNYFNFLYIPAASAAHREACGLLEVAMAKYNEAVDAIGSVQYMCNMIEPVMYEPLVDGGLKKYCLDGQDLNGRVYGLAGYKERIKDLLSLRPQALVVKERMADLNCSGSAE